MYVAWFRLNAAPPNCVSSFAFVTVTPGLPGVCCGAAALGIETVVCSTRGQAQSLPQSPGQAASSVPSHCSVPLATPSPQAGRRRPRSGTRHRGAAPCRRSTGIARRGALPRSSCPSRPRAGSRDGAPRRAGSRSRNAGAARAPSRDTRVGEGTDRGSDSRRSRPGPVARRSGNSSRGSSPGSSRRMRRTGMRSRCGRGARRCRAHPSRPTRRRGRGRPPGQARRGSASRGRGAGPFASRHSTASPPAPSRKNRDAHHHANPLDNALETSNRADACGPRHGG